MQTGLFRHRVTIQKPSGTPDSAGHLSNTGFTDYLSRKARIEPTLGNERKFGGLIEAGISHVVTLHYDHEARAISPNMRLLHGTRVLNIKSVIVREELSREVQLNCDEVQ